MTLKGLVLKQWQEIEWWFIFIFFCLVKYSLVPLSLFRFLLQLGYSRCFLTDRLFKNKLLLLLLLVPESSSFPCNKTLNSSNHGGTENS
ncbi:hypothetical protein RIF29_22262 [Crotalaria pallida]|uniref:Uncharacterized protein n=1 Tax=Crotalaria pallida TaxID=3830 RepID=A0AAN9IEA2_CROPI